MLNKHLQGPGPTASVLLWKLRMLGFTSPVCVAPRRMQLTFSQENALYMLVYHKRRGPHNRENTHALATTVLLAGEEFQEEAPDGLPRPGSICVGVAGVLPVSGLSRPKTLNAILEYGKLITDEIIPPFSAHSSSDQRKRLNPRTRSKVGKW